MKLLFKTLLLFIFIAITGLPGAQQVSAQIKSPDSFFLPEVRTDHPAIPNIDVLIDVGHGGIDGGATFGEIREKDINLSIAKKTYETMRRKGLVVLINRIDDYALSGENLWLKSRSRHIKDLAQRAHLANEMMPKVFISLHVNSAKRAGKGGPLMLYQKNDNSKAIANALQRSLNPIYTEQNEPVYGRTYYLLNHVKAHSVIVEMGFITNKEDRALLLSQKGQQAIANKITEGVQAYLESIKVKN